MKYDEKVHHTLWALSFFFFLIVLPWFVLFLATRDALVINGSYPGFFTSSLSVCGLWTGTADAIKNQVQ